MALGQSVGAARSVRTLYRLGAVGGMSDAELLTRFQLCRDEAGEAAFEALVRRHGPMVLRVGRDILGDLHEAHDAFQATFLVLARRAPSIERPDSLGPWIYGVSRRIALKARGELLRRRRRERALAAAVNDRSRTDGDRAELAFAVHEELARLSKTLRAPVVLCYLEGMSYEQAAMHLGVSEATVRGRLARAKERLRARLSSDVHGQPALLLATLPTRMPLATFPPALVQATVQSASVNAARGPVFAAILTGCREAVSQWRAGLWRSTAAACFASVVVATGACVLAQQGPATEMQEPGAVVGADRGHSSAPVLLERPRPAAIQNVTLDEAILRLFASDNDLRSKFSQIPQARVDVLTALLRADPNRYVDGQLVPYSRYVRQRPASLIQYDVNIEYPLRLSQKRAARTAVALARPRTIVEAQYQDAARLRVDNLYRDYVAVLAAREIVRLAQAENDWLERIDATVRNQYRANTATKSDLTRMKIQREQAALGVQDARTTLEGARRRFALRIGIGDDEANQIDVTGELREHSGTLPPLDELVREALNTRPDVAAIRLTLAGLEDLAGESDPKRTPQLRFAENIAHTRVELVALEEQIAAEVRNAWREFESSLKTATETDDELLPRAKQVRDDALRLHADGQTGALVVLQARRDYVVLLKQSTDLWAKHLSSRLDLNTAVGRRISP